MEDAHHANSLLLPRSPDIKERDRGVHYADARPHRLPHEHDGAWHEPERLLGSIGPQIGFAGNDGVDRDGAPFKHGPCVNRALYSGSNDEGEPDATGGAIR
jgi:hypothetical protein